MKIIPLIFAFIILITQEASSNTALNAIGVFTRGGSGGATPTDEERLSDRIYAGVGVHWQTTLHSL